MSVMIWSDPTSAEALFRAAVEVLPTGIVIADRTGTIVMVNRQVEAIFGYEEGELVGRPVEMLIPAAAREAHAQQRGRFTERPTPRRMGAGRELFGLHKDGRQVPVEIGLAPTSHGGEPLILASIIDITERQRHEHTVKAAAARWHALMESATDGVAILSYDGITIEVNQRLASILGLPVDEVLGRHLRSFVHPDNATESLAAFADAVVAGSGRAEGISLRRPDGTSAVVDFTVSNVDFADQRAVLCIGRDVTEKRMLEQRLQQSQRVEAVGRLAGGVAHDFNNLLTTILGYAEFMSDSLPAGSAALEDAEEIKKAANRAAELTRQLLAFSRQQVLVPTVLNLNGVVADVEKMLRRMIGEDVRLVTRLSSDLGNVKADRGQLEQVLMNLAVNARDAMPGGGVLTVETANVHLTEAYTATHQPLEAGRYVMLAVADTGVGMSEEVRARVFEPFFTTKEMGKGTGLGLATVYGIVKQSGGFIWVEGAPGSGATFRIYLPRSDKAADAAVRPITTAQELRGAETVLLVEDDELLRPMARAALSRYGYQVLEAPDAATAMLILRGYDGPIDVLLTDMVLPDEGGLALSRHARVERPRLRVVFMSGYTDEAVVRQGRLPGGTTLLQKPFTPEALARRIREVVGA